MANRDMVLSALRGGVVLLSAAAMTCIIFSWAQPLFLLRVEALHSSLDQTIFTTHVYTPLGERRVAVTEYYTCRSLIEAFRVAQFASMAALIFAILTFVMSAFQSSALVTAHRYRERALCALPVSILMSCAAVCQLTTLLVFEFMYGRRWCTTSSHHDNHTSSSSSSYFGASSDDETCDPFDGCVLSYKEMGFVKREGLTLMWAALACTAATLACELVLWYVALRDTEPAATLLLQPTGDDDDMDDGNNNNHNAAGGGDDVAGDAEAGETQPLL